MGLIIKSTFGMVCDGCKHYFKPISNNPAFYLCQDDALQAANDSGWREIKGKWFCPRCYHYDEGTKANVPNYTEEPDGAKGQEGEKPKYGEPYYMPVFTEDRERKVPALTVWRNTERDNYRFIGGLCFKTLDECQKQCDTENQWFEEGAF